LYLVNFGGKGCARLTDLTLRRFFSFVFFIYYKSLTLITNISTEQENLILYRIVPKNLGKDGVMLTHQFQQNKESINNMILTMYGTLKKNIDFFREWKRERIF